MWIGIAIGAGIYLSLLLIVTFATLRPVRSPLFLSPGALGVNTEEISFKSDGYILRGWWCGHDNPKAVFVLLHGYVMNRSENAALAAQFHKLGFSCLLFDFRASGKSGGKQVGIGWSERNDVLNACHFAGSLCPDVPRILLGSSMGSAAAAFAVAQNANSAQAIILDSCYSSFAKATLGWWRFLGGLPAMILLAPVILIAWPFTRFNPFRVDVAKALAQIKCPTLLIHGKRDNLALPHHATRNYKHAAGPKDLIWFETAGHSEARWTEAERYKDEVIQFLERNGIISTPNSV